MKHLCLIFFAVCWIFLSCDHEEASDSSPEFHLTVVTSFDGLGDMGYNDQVMAGVMRFYEANDVSLSLIRPHKTDDVNQILQNWLTSTQHQDNSLLVLAGNEYEQLLTNRSLHLSGSQQILLFESKNSHLPEGVSTFCINRYGASYLAGCMAKEHEAATIIAAMKNNPILEESIHGFSDGYETHSSKKAEVKYLSAGGEGFAMADSAYRIASQIHNAFIFPLAGGSNQGIYKYSREEDFYLPLIVGMDRDCSLVSDRIPFSMVVHIDKVVEKYLTDWMNQVPFPKNQTFGLNTGITDIVISPVFYQNLIIWEDYYDHEDYWENAYQNHKTEASEKEERHEEP